MPSLKLAAQWGMLLAASAALAAALHAAGFPAALLLGPMLAAILVSLAGAGLRVPRIAFLGAQAIVGCLIARSITPAIVLTIAQAWPAMLIAAGATIMASGSVGFLLTRFGRLPGAAAAWGSAPGAASAMVAMAEEHGADGRLVAFMQYVRVVCVVLAASAFARLWLGAAPRKAPVAPEVVPFADQMAPLGATVAIAAAGALIGRRLGIPAGALLGPMILGAALNAGGLVVITMPEWLLGGAYAAIGWFVGLRFNRGVIGHVVRASPRILAATLALMTLCGLSAIVLMRILGTDPLSAFLATSPGGIDSIAIIAVGSGADVPFVLAVQTLRLFVVVLAGPTLARLIARHAPRT